ncbi:cell envelope integrity protein CreD [Alteromonas sp. KUL49]|uniref:cell envelope integrity protein CreD n=1 Tax=Alteromonas sp. KUL49 TaxID=2480798 RepID=UPI00102EE27A|nr:cell envelope integrity protein CreD [Alteromonas sp. KUL49]TAP41490.1 cell envelope integrity protein CreD [Alteromonas sp. KUL49]GEA10581.1 cell envelope integrity protein CreD [Alteromonas sp. KUL49]
MQQSITNKCIAVVVITVALVLVLTVISGKISERERYFDEAKDKVASSWTSSQQLAPLVIALPYKVPVIAKDGDLTVVKYDHHVKMVAPSLLSIESELAHSNKVIGIFNVPIYTSVIRVNGTLERNFFKELFERISADLGTDNVEFFAPYAVTLISDVRGINRISSLQWNDTSLNFSSGNQSVAPTGGIHVPLPQDVLSHNQNPINFAFEIELRGMESLDIFPTGLQTELTTKANWPHPRFDGGFLPTSSQIDSDGYVAKWSVTSYASNIDDKLSACNEKACKQLLASSMGVSHINPVDIYTQTDRSTKYGILFIGLCFTIFLLFEVLAKRAIHPIQYILVGLANAIFYLLLLSLSEHIYFALSYVIGAVGCIGIIYFYMKPVLQERFYLWGFMGLLVLLYATLYFIISMEDTALLAGASLSFIVLATVMVLTRHVDWYGLLASNKDSESKEEYLS